MSHVIHAAWLVCVLAMPACEMTLDDRLAELDDRVEVDCGEVWGNSKPEADAVVVCMRENLAAGIRAKAFFVLGLDPVAHVYALEGSYVNVEGSCYEGCDFTESRCRDLAVTGTGRARAIDCEYVRDWYEPE